MPISLLARRLAIVALMVTFIQISTEIQTLKGFQVKISFKEITARISPNVPSFKDSSQPSSRNIEQSAQVPSLEMLMKSNLTIEADARPVIYQVSTNSQSIQSTTPTIEADAKPVTDDVSANVQDVESLTPSKNLNQTLASLAKIKSFESVTQPLSQSSTEIPMSPNSTLAADLSRIWHDPEEGSICVHLKEDARCPYPALLGRLSGPALAMLDWSERKNEAEKGTIHCGHYNNKWLDTGDYFVEILVINCNDFGIGAIERVQSEKNWLEVGFAKQCVEDALRNRITTKEGSTISITLSTEGKGSYRLGRWVRREGLPNRPLFTRMQPVECTDSNYMTLKHAPKWCNALIYRDNPGESKRSGLWKFKEGQKIVGLPEYKFQWRMNITEGELIERLRKRLHGASKPFPKICAVGDSHSRVMVQNSLPLLNLTGLLKFVQSYWILPGKIRSKIRDAQCDQIFIQIGQWPASFYSQGNPFSFDEYYKKMKKHVENTLKELENKPEARIYLPTIDQNPLNSRINDCNDWRTPTVLNGYSMVNQMIERDLNTTKVKYMDINFIISTHWDGGTDWGHLLGDVRYRKTIYMSALILGELEGLSN